MWDYEITDWTSQWPDSEPEASLEGWGRSQDMSAVMCPTLSTLSRYSIYHKNIIISVCLLSRLVYVYNSITQLLIEMELLPGKFADLFQFFVILTERDWVRPRESQTACSWLGHCTVTLGQSVRSRVSLLLLAAGQHCHYTSQHWAVSSPQYIKHALHRLDMIFWVRTLSTQDI